MKKVLVIDDDTSSRFLVKKILEKKNIKVLEAENGIEGLRIVKSEPDLSLILLDLIMPIMNGQDFLSALNQEGIKIPVIVLSTDDDKAKESKIRGAKDFMVKPIKPIDLIELVTKYSRD